jgi:hypothetical protein
MLPPIFGILDPIGALVLGARVPAVVGAATLQFVEIPPPSKVELGMDATPDVVVVGQGAAPGRGLMPPIFSSVAPIGMDPVGAAELDGSVPRGDVGPMPGDMPTCAMLALQPTRVTTTTVVITYRIGIPASFMRRVSISNSRDEMKRRRK